MKPLLIAAVVVLCCAGCVKQKAEGEGIDAYVAKKGPPLLVAPAYKFEVDDFRKIKFFGLSSGPTTALRQKSDRYLVYSTDGLFSEDARLHFKRVLDPKSYTGSTMFAVPMTSLFGTSASPIEIEVVHFDSSGHFVDDRRLQIHIAYFEEGTEGHLITRTTHP